MVERGGKIIAETPRLFLRQFAREDALQMNAILGDPEVMRYSRTGPMLPEQIATYLQRWMASYRTLGYGLWGVVDRQTEELTGYCGLNAIEVDGQAEVEMGYRLARSHWGRGLATEAASAVAEVAFERLRLPRLIAIIDPRNVESQRVAEKVGLAYEKDATVYGLRLRIYAAQHN